MRYISLAMFAEGPSDHVFLQRLIYRVVHEQAFNVSTEPVEIAETFVRPARLVSLPAQRHERVAALFQTAISEGAVTLLFVHADADGDADITFEQRIEPVRRAIARIAPNGFQFIALVPVQMTETWALADPDALRAEWGTTIPPEDLGLPPTRRLEALDQPKEVLRQARRVAIGRRRRSRQSVDNLGIPPGLGERVNLDNLRLLPAFRRFEEDVMNALNALWPS